MSRIPAFLTTLALLATVVVVVPAPAGAATERVLTITSDTAKPKVTFRAFDAQPLKLYDLDGDGKMEIIAHNDNRYVYVFDSKDGDLLAELTTKYPSGWGARPLNGVEAAALWKGAAPRLIVANSAAYITSFRFDADASTANSFKFVKEWERRLNDCHSNPGMDSKVALADLDKDGKLEILAQTEEIGVFALRHNGDLMWKKCIGGGNGDATVGDVDGDGWPDPVFGSDGGRVTVANGKTGKTKWTFYMGRNSGYNLGSASMPVGPTVKQLDGKGGDDIVVGVKDNSDCKDFSKNHAGLFAISGTGKLLWWRQYSSGNPLTYTHPVVADVDKDGKQDVVWADWNTQGKSDNCGNYEKTGPGRFYRYSSGGTLVWAQSLDTFWSNNDVIVVDADGDGDQEVLANGPSGKPDGIWYLNVETGAKETFVSTWPYKVTRGPVAEDLWGTGTLQWVVPVYKYGDSADEGGGIQVYDTKKPFKAAWPHLPYAGYTPGTEGGSGGGGGGDPDPDPDPDPPSNGSGGFEPTFTVAQGVNTWWVEVKVAAGEAVSGVTATVDGGSGVALSKTSWGWWAKSFHVPQGSKVVFTAKAASGATAKSGAFTWPAPGATSGTSGTSGGTDPPPPDPDPPPPDDGISGFQPTFTPRSVGNDWWIEVKVTANLPVAGVDTKVGSGVWTRLDATSWGTWAKSLKATDGTVVKFRAISDSGTVVESDPVTWT